MGQRLIDEFLAKRSRTAHLVVVVTTRTASKSRATLATLRQHLRAAVRSQAFRRRFGGDAAAAEADAAVARVHLASIELDLCRLDTIYAGADRLVNGTLRLVGEDGTEEGPAVSLPRLDTVVLNAGTGLWTGINYPVMLRSLLFDGLVFIGSYPKYKISTVGSLIYPLGGKETGPRPASPPAVGEAFCANVFGHYMLARRLVPLLSRPGPGRPGGDDGVPTGRVVWTSSIEPLDYHFDLDDFQALRTPDPYESTKRLTDLLALTADLPGVRPYSTPFFALPSTTTTPATGPVSAGPTTPPKMYLVHPGVVASNIFPLNVFLTAAMWAMGYLLRWWGSPWHTLSPYLGACAPTWLALADDSTLSALNAERVKWGSACTSRFFPEAQPKMTEVDGWGWDGTVEDREAIGNDPAQGVLRKLVGRDPRIADDHLSKERREDFEARGAACWREMERLRLAFEERIAAAAPVSSGKPA